MNAPMMGKDSPWAARIVFKNADAAAMPIGCAAILVDGKSVNLPSTAGAAKSNALLAGIVVATRVSPANSGMQLDIGDWGEIIAGGWCPITRLVKATKAASSDAWPSFAAGAIGDKLNVETVNNGFVNAGSVASSLAALVVLMESYVSATTVASGAYSGSVPLAATALTVNVKSWVKCLG